MPLSCRNVPICIGWCVQVASLFADGLLTMIILSASVDGSTRFHTLGACILISLIGPSGL